MRVGTVRFALEGLSLERLLNQCVEAGIILSDVQRPKVRVITATISSGQFKYIKNLAKKNDWKLTMRKVTGLPRLREFAWRRAALIDGALVFMAVSWYLCNCIWSIQIHGAGPYLGEVRQVLLDNEITPGRFNMNVDVEELRTLLARRLSGLAWVSVSVDGVRLKVYCVQGVPRAESDLADAPRDIYASRDGVVESVRIAAGTAQVKQGDAVRKGQLLIKGEERAWGESVNAVAARGEVLARVWYTAESIIPATETVSIPNGELTQRKVYVTPWYEWSPWPPPVFEDSETVDAQARYVLIGAILPVWLRLEEYEPVTLESRPRNDAALKYESALAALRLAQEAAGLDKPIVDKWVEYSMIDNVPEFGMNPGMKAHLTLEVMENIAK
ncbi:MAG: sporulation protein YqfD [Oscillospiraceae bacterium]|jgi:similar to stage IV sporulation protein|nr:sporulation protein YqfD [Oscillospiraceae bacterium]